MGRLLTPDPVDEAIGRDSLVGIDQQDAQDAALSAVPYVDALAVHPYFDVPQDTQRHCLPFDTHLT
ncbi:hypothetical protein AB0E55_07750 [Amycolatopsis keratiniphila]|uniref:hypothetical protein n=1 Tax=Amycolatopsis keratiniphila TaxID=129921 RepID=UPI0033FA3875